MINNGHTEPSSKKIILIPVAAFPAMSSAFDISLRNRYYIEVPFLAKRHVLPLTCICRDWLSGALTLLLALKGGEGVMQKRRLTRIGTHSAAS